uniref:Uncharacterized protein n=1 Tax=Cacopsylla melanoneura TaxID=428564 RepID=A0A8D9F1A1_9HEMI
MVFTQNNTIVKVKTEAQYHETVHLTHRRNSSDIFYSNSLKQNNKKILSTPGINRSTLIFSFFSPLNFYMLKVGVLKGTQLLVKPSPRLELNFFSKYSVKYK